MGAADPEGWIMTFEEYLHLAQEMRAAGASTDAILRLEG